MAPAFRCVCSAHTPDRRSSEVVLMQTLAPVVRLLPAYTVRPGTRQYSESSGVRMCRMCRHIDQWPHTAGSLHYLNTGDKRRGGRRGVPI